MHPSAATLTLAAGRIAKTDLSKTACPRLDVAGYGVLEQFKLQSSQGVFEPERRNPLRKDRSLDERQELRYLYYPRAYYSVA